VRHVSADLAVRTLHPLLHLLEERVDQLRSLGRLERGGQTTLIAQRDIVGHGVMRAAGQLGGIADALGESERFQDLHDHLVRLQQLLPVDGLFGDWPVEPGGAPRR
jgi:hypothetical protein